MSQRHELKVRVDAVQAIVDRWSGKPFHWGRSDCGRAIVAPILKAMGHKCPLARFGTYRNEFGARRALKREGFDSMEHFLDLFPLMRIGHASALPGDLVGLRALGDDGKEADWMAITVVLGNGRVFGFLNDVAQVVQPLETAAAWRVPCRR